MKGSKKKQKKEIKYSSASKYSSSKIFGSRYIFFKSVLQNDKDNQDLFHRAEGHFNKIKTQINKTFDPEDIDSFQFLTAMVSELEQMAQRMLNSEMQYAKKLLNQIDEIEGFYSNKFKKQLKDTYEQLQNSNQFDYLLLIRLFSELMSDHDKLEQSLKEQKNNLEILSKNFSMLNKDEQEKLREEYIWTPNDYNMNDTIKRITSIDFIYSPLMAQLSDAFNNAIKELQESPRFKELIQNLLSDASSQTSYKEITSFIVHYIVQHYKKLSGKQKQQYMNRLKKEVIDLFNSQKNLYQENILSFFTNKMKSLEELAITKSDAPLAKIFLTYTEATQKFLLQKYTAISFKDNNEWIAWKRKLETTNGKNNNFRRQLTIALRKGIEAEYKKIYDQIETAWSTTEKTITAEQIQKVILKQIETNEDTFSKFIHVARLSKDQIAEITATPAFTEKINIIIQNGLLGVYYGGSETQLKTDAHVTILFEPDIKQIIDTSTVDQEFANIVKYYLGNFYKNFHNRYKKNARQSTSIEKAYQSYFEQMEELYNDIMIESKKQLDHIEAQRVASEMLEKSFSEEISVKEYLFYNNELGFHMGNLGAGERVSTVVNNIYFIYDKMGLTGLPEANLIIEAILNASNKSGATFFSNNDDTIQKIKQLLIGGAALISFDAGFAYTKKFLNEIKSKFFKTDFQHIEIYRLNSALFIPASYILRNITENLKSFLNIVTQDLRELTLKTNDSKIYINNNLSYDIFKNDNNFKKLSTQQKWETVADYAEQNVKITMLFLSGLLDIFENLPELIQKF